MDDDDEGLESGVDARLTVGNWLAIVASTLAAVAVCSLGIWFVVHRADGTGETQAQKQDRAIRACEESARKTLRDPGSAQFTDWVATPQDSVPTTGEHWTASGMVNGKNGFGGYAGGEPFTCDAYLTPGQTFASARPSFAATGSSS